MDTEKLTGFDRISGKNGLFPPVLPISPAFSFPVKATTNTENLNMNSIDFTVTRGKDYTIDKHFRRNLVK